MSNDTLDAARYRWLRDHSHTSPSGPYIQMSASYTYSGWLTGELADQAVDAAMSGQILPTVEQGMEIDPCPFCGWQPPYNDEDEMMDVLYPSGVWWADEIVDNCVVRVYRTHSERKPNDEKGWCLNCTHNMGGCGAILHADTKAEVINKWNRRSKGTV